MMPTPRRHSLARTAAALAIVALSMVASPRQAAAQFGSFGQNKIQYRDFDWHVLKGEHVDVYFYPAEEAIARMALSYAEESFTYLQERFNHEVTLRVPLIVYASHSDFEQTNVLPFVPPEGILGVTEYMKRRVAMPFRGSYAEFRHTLRHEMVHVYQLSMLTQQLDMYPRANRAGLPLWWSEGLAEFMSSPQESRDDMVLRDLTLNGRLPTIDELSLTGSGIVYPVGGDLHHFLANKYGAWRINLVYQSLYNYSSFSDVIRGVYGKTTRELTDEWHYELRQRYYPAVEGRRPIGLVGSEIASLALKPAPMGSADSAVHVAYLSPRSGYTNIYSKPLAHPDRRPRVVVAGERTPEFESLHAFSSRMDSRDGVLIFASKYLDRDALFFWDVKRRRVVGRYQFDSLVAILSPAWSPDGKRVAFSGLSMGGISDLYVLDLPTGDLTRATDDHYEDLDPTWLPDGNTLVFASDRGPNGQDGFKNLSRLSLSDGAVAPVTSGHWNDEAPRWDPDLQRVLFTSDRDGTFNLFSVDSLGQGRRETRLDGGVFDPAPIPGDSRVLVAGFSDLSWSIYAIRPDTGVRSETFAMEQPGLTSSWAWAELADTATASVSPTRYERRFALDFAAGGGDYAPGSAYGSGGGAQLFFSDLLGDHAIATSFSLHQSSSAGGAADILDNINASVFYLNQTRRLNWGVGAFRQAGIFQERDLSQLYSETSGGGYGVLRYPLSRFTRVEGQAGLEYSNRDDFANDLVEGPQRRKGLLATNFVSLVNDNSLWLSTGPIDGMRYNLTAGVVSDITHGVFENWIGSVDVRRYFRTSLQSAFAVRALGYASEGVRPRAISIGGTWYLRGYPRYGGAATGTRAWLLNSEWRFPITNFVTIGFPFGAVRFPQVQGALFADAGQAWRKSQYDERVMGSAGIGFRVGLVPGLVLRWDVGRRYSINGDQDDPDYKSRFVNFFFGYNY